MISLVPHAIKQNSQMEFKGCRRIITDLVYEEYFNEVFQKVDLIFKVELREEHIKK